MIVRQEYVALLEKWRDKHVIKVVTGIRRCGKSSLLQMYRGHLLATGVSAKQVHTYNFEDFALVPLLAYRALYAHVREHLCPGNVNIGQFVRPLGQRRCFLGTFSWPITLL